MRFTHALSCWLVAALLALTRAAAGQGGEPAEREQPAGSQDEASRLRHDAIYDDYLATLFDDAHEKLARAVALCEGATPCDAAFRARLHCDLGVIDFALGKTSDAKRELAKAMAIDPAVTITHDLSTPDLEKRLAEVRAAREAPSGNAPSGDAPSGEGTDCPPDFPGCADRSAANEEPAGPAPEVPFKSNWLRLSFDVDALFLPSADDACRGGTGYSCFRGDTYYSGLPLKGADDAVNGGIRPATMRVLLGFDRAIGANFTLGARVGWAFRGGPPRPGARTFDPFHAEVSASYWFGHDPLARRGVRPYVTAALGTAQVDASIPVDAYASVGDYRAGKSQDYDAWKKTGLGFGALGLGAVVAPVPDGGVFLEVRALQMFPTAGVALALQLGCTLGL
jgi:hypothetical protein